MCKMIRTNCNVIQMQIRNEGVEDARQPFGHGSSYLAVLVERELWTDRALRLQLHVPSSLFQHNHGILVVLWAY